MQTPTMGRGQQSYCHAALVFYLFPKLNQKGELAQLRDGSTLCKAHTAHVYRPGFCFPFMSDSWRNRRQESFVTWFLGNWQSSPKHQASFRRLKHNPLKAGSDSSDFQSVSLHFRFQKRLSSRAEMMPSFSSFRMKVMQESFHNSMQTLFK